MPIDFKLTPLKSYLPILPTNGIPSNSIGADESVAQDLTTGTLYFKDPAQGWIVAFVPGAAGGSSPPSGVAGGDLGGTYPNPTLSKITNALTSYGGIALVAKGIPLQVASAGLVTQAANVGATTLYTVPAGGAGWYRVSVQAVVTQAATTSSSLPNVGVTWTDSDSNVALSATTLSPTNTANAPGAFGLGSQMMYVKAGTNIQYQTSNYASVGATPMQYAVRARLEYLG